MKKMLYIVLVMMVLGVAVSSICAAENRPDEVLVKSWPSEFSDLLPDPDLKRGRLENGFRYVVKENHEPEDRVAVYLYVNAGSLQESEDQRGVAHFLEHMMFNGSANFPPGSLIDFFQSIGMDFGGDTNAYTSYDKTVYNIILPDGSRENLEAAFLVMSDYAKSALLRDQDIDRERKVILAEKRARDSARYRIREASSSYAFRGTRYAKRFPIGLESTIENADRKLLKTYYDSWYRPENIVLVVVGDVESAEVEGLIEKQFQDMQPADQPMVRRDFGFLKHKGVEAFYYHEPELGQVNLSIEVLSDVALLDDSLGFERQKLYRYIGSMVMRYRLQRILEGEDLPFVNASYYTGNLVNRIAYGTLSAQSDAKNWKDALSYLEHILRQALEFGVKADELDRAKKELLVYFEENVKTSESNDSRELAQRIVNHLNSNRVFQSPLQEKEIYGPMVVNATINDINQELKNVWSSDSRLLSVTGDVLLKGDSEAAIKTVYTKAQHELVVSPKADQKVEFPYLQTPLADLREPVRSINQETEVEHYIYDNGLVVNLKTTDFDKNKFQVVANFGLGRIAEVAKGSSVMLADLINDSGTGVLRKSSLDKLIADSSIGIGFRVGSRSFSWSGYGLSEEFPLFCQLLYTLLVDPGGRKSVYQRIFLDTEMFYKTMAHKIEGAVPLKVRPYLSSYSGHTGLPSWEIVRENDFSNLLEYISKVKSLSGLEISVVGDFDKEVVLAEIVKNFSGMILGKPAVAKNIDIDFPVGGTLDIAVNTTDKKSLVTIAWPTDDIWDIKRTRRLHLLAKIFEDRLRKQVREALGASYAPSVSSYNSKELQGYGYLRAQVLVNPGDENRIIAEILQISERLREDGSTLSELERSKKPLLTSIKESVKSNHYWLRSVLSLSSRYPEQLQWPQTILSDFSLINLTEVNDVAAEYLNNNRAAIIKVVPEMKEVP